MTTNNIKTEIIAFTRKLNTEMLPSMAFNSKKAALDAIESLTKLLATVAEDEMKSAFDTPVTSTVSVVNDEDTFDDFYDPADDFSEEEIKSHTTDPFGNDSLADVLESIDPRFNRNKLGPLKEATVGQYLRERLASSFVQPIITFLKKNPDPSVPADSKSVDKLYMDLKRNLTKTNTGTREHDLRFLNANQPEYPKVESANDYADKFMYDFKSSCGRFNFNYRVLSKNDTVIDVLVRAFESYAVRKLDPVERADLVARLKDTLGR